VIRDPFQFVDLDAVDIDGERVLMTHPLTLLQSPDPVLVEFYVKTCPPCHRLEPKLVKFAQDHDLRVLKIDCFRFEDIAEQFKIEGTPTVLVVKNGMEYARQEGAMTVKELEALLAKAQ